MLAFFGGVAFSIAAVLQIINGPDVDKYAAWPFWLFVGLALLAFHAAFGVAMPTRRR